MKEKIYEILNWGLPGTHECDEYGAGCEMENYTPSFPGAHGRYLRCKLRRIDLEKIASDIEKAIV